MAPRKKDETRLTAYKNNRIIYIGDAQRVDRWDELTPNQLKIAMYSAAQVRPNDTALDEYAMPFKEFAALAGLDEDSAGGKDYKRIFAEARKLAKLGVDFIAADGTLIGFNWLVSVRVSPKSGVVNYSIDKNLLPFYKTRAGSFALIELADYMRLRGKYALLLYEFLAKWRTAGQVYQSIPALRSQLQVPENLYKRTVDFMRRVVDGAVEEINEKTEVSFKVKMTEKRGLRSAVEGIFFTIKPIMAATDEQDALLELMTAVEVAPQVALALLNDPAKAINQEYVGKNISAANDYIKLLINRGEPTKSKKAIYTAALLNDWAGVQVGIPLFEAEDVAPPGLCPICDGVGIVTGPDGRMKTCSCLAVPADTSGPEDHERPWEGKIVDILKDVLAGIGNGPSERSAEPQTDPSPVRETPEVLRKFLEKGKREKTSAPEGAK